MLKELVRYCRRKEKETAKIFNFTLTTNCLLLSDEVINWIISNNISVILSLDGRKQTNDKNRLLCSGEGTYDLIVPRIKKMITSKPVSYYVRGTFTRENLDFSNDLMHMAELGFESLSLEPAVGPENGFSIKEEDIPRVLEEYERLTDVLFNYYILGKNINFFHYDVD
ncbi:MAG: thioether cross-link-forming SCIFF peptide maturase, partial [Syntrophomonadaceae bacterium]|nr:thioether cross-link-forming SCIFF peptide maturase [Syntrophomonadaceae bacterium]